MNAHGTNTITSIASLNMFVLTGEPAKEIHKKRGITYQTWGQVLTVYQLGWQTRHWILLSFSFLMCPKGLTIMLIDRDMVKTRDFLQCKNISYVTLT